MTTSLRGVASLLTRLLLLTMLLLSGSCRSQDSGGGHAEDAAAVGTALGNDEIALIDEAGRDFAERRVMDVYDQVAPSVVTITTTVVQLSFFFEPVPAEGAGSGFVVDDEGRIVTNFHVIEGAQRIEVTFSDGTTVPARIVGVDPINDLAVLQVEAHGLELRPVELGSSEDLEVGQRAIAIGNPFGQFGQSLTTGVVSALDRTLRGAEDRQITGVIQTDAAINRGNSGGPLLDSAGRVIGVNTAIFSPTGTSAGLGFAIPVDTVKRVLPELIEFGRYRHPWLGIDGAYTLSEGLARVLDLPVEQGLLLVQLREGSPLDIAGVRGAQRQAVLGNTRVFLGGDIVTAVDGRAVTTRGELRTYLESNYRVGDELEVTIVRGSVERQLSVVLAEQPQ
ncbi:MAG TPA: trypsin-like peptidase domain-containing protein [Trueperaceae bacterium]